MTGANLINLFQSEGISLADSMTSQKMGRDKQGGDMFESILNQTPVVQEKTITKDSISSADTSYEKFKYKDKSIEPARDNPIKAKIDNSKEELGEFEEKVIKTVSEELGVSEEDVEETMAVLGLSVFDLLEPANLAKLTVELTESADTVSLLTDDVFQKLLSEVGELTEELMDNLDLNVSQFDELVKQMTVIGESEDMELDSSMADLVDHVLVGEQVLENENTEATVVAEAEETIETVNIKDSGEAKIADDNVSKENASEENAEDLVVLQKETKTDEKDSSFDDSNKNESKQSGTKNGENLIHFENNMVSDVDNADIPIMTEASNASTESSYISTETTDIINQLVEKVKVSGNSEITNLEMQLNPANLGKIYLNLSSKQGNVSAQIFATNEMVKEALENQMVELRESLSQAGVKVDALEVTVASHEFERNLEQNQSREEQEGAYQEKSSKKRRNINMSSLDELTGLMTEEEALVAQMMHDNGNSVDLTA